MSAFRQSTSALRVSSRSVARPQQVALRSLRQPIRFASTQAASPVHSHTPMWIVLGVLVTGGGALFYYVKPIRELAQKAHGAMDSAKDTTSQASGLASQAANLAGLGPVFAVSSYAYNKLQENGGLTQFLQGISSDIKNQDVDAALEKIKKVGGKDVQPYIEEVEKAVKSAGGKLADVDWQSIVGKIEKEAGDDIKGLLQFIKPYIPASGPVLAALATGNFDPIVKKIKEQGGDQLKDLEDTAQKLYKKAQDVTKDGKGNVEDLIKQLKEADGKDLDKILKQVKDLASKAGIPADTIESWIADKGGKIDTDQLVKRAQSLASEGSGVVEKVQHFDLDKAVGSVKTISPALASLLALALQQAGVKLGSAGKASAGSAQEQFEQAKKQLETLTGSLSTASSGLSKDLQSRLTTLQSDLKKTLDSAPSVSSSADAAKESAKQGKKTSAAESKQEDWEKALKQLKADSTKAVEGAVKDLEKAVEGGKAGDGAKTALKAVKGYLGN